MYGKDCKFEVPVGRSQAFCVTCGVLQGQPCGKPAPKPKKKAPAKAKAKAKAKSA